MVSKPERIHTENGGSQYLKLHNQNRTKRTKLVSFTSLLPIILPQLDNDKAMQLQTLYDKLKKNDVPKEVFVRVMRRDIVGDQLLRFSVEQELTATPVINSRTSSEKPSALQEKPLKSTEAGDAPDSRARSVITM